MKKAGLLWVLIVLMGAVIACAPKPTPPQEEVPPVAQYYTVYFTGEGIDIPSQRVAAGRVAERPPTPQRSGFVFADWLKEGRSYAFETPVTEDITLTALWQSTESCLTGSGTRADPYRIGGKTGFLAFADLLKGNAEKRNAFTVLTGDVELGGMDFAPIPVFSGELDGRGHTICNVRITQSANGGAGLFGMLSNARVSALVLHDVSVQGDETCTAAGGLAGYAHNSTLEGITVQGSVIAAKKNAVAGGIVGQLKADATQTATLSHSFADVTVVGDSAGGLVGQTRNAAAASTCITQCGVLLQAISSEATSRAATVSGGLAGVTDARTAIVHCWAQIGRTQSVSGGLTGQAIGDCAVSDCYFVAAAGTKAVGIFDVDAFAADGFTAGTVCLNTACLEVQPSADRLVQAFGFSAEDWDFSGEYPLPRRHGSAQAAYTVTLAGVGSAESFSRRAGEPLGEIAPCATGEGEICTGWYFDANCTVAYRAYLPVFKHRTLYADIRNLQTDAGGYFTENGRTGVVLRADGTAEILQTDESDFADCTYFADKVRLVTLSGEQSLLVFCDESSICWQTVGGSVMLTRSLSAAVGTYASKTGELLILYDNSAVYDDGKGETLSGICERNGSVLSVTFGDRLGVATVSVGRNGTLSVAFSSGTAGGVFSPLQGRADYTGRSFLGAFSCASADGSSASVAFLADGTWQVNGAAAGIYRYYDASRTIKLFCKGRYSTLRLSDAGLCLYGIADWSDKRGAAVLSRSPAVCMPVDFPQATLFVCGPEHILWTGEDFVFPAVEGTLEEETLTELVVDGRRYLYFVCEGALFRAGSEAGVYTCTDGVFTVSGTGKLSGALRGRYVITHDTRLHLVLKDGTRASFDYEQAKAESFRCTFLPIDAFAGQWQSGNTTLTADGFGLFTVESANGIGSLCGEYTPATLLSAAGTLGGKNGTLRLWYGKNAAVWQDGQEQTIFVRAGYDGPTVPPVMPAQYIGAWADGQGLSLSVTDAGAVTLGGSTVQGEYDGLALYFVANGKTYTVTAVEDGLLLTDGLVVHKLSQPGPGAESSGVYENSDTGFLFTLVLLPGGSGTLTYYDDSFAQITVAFTYTVDASDGYTVTVDPAADAIDELRLQADGDGNLWVEATKDGFAVVAESLFLKQAA